MCSLIARPELNPHDIELCVVEAVNNAIEHAYKNRSDQEVEVVLTLYANRLMVDVCDRGKRMDPALVELKKMPSLEADPAEFAYLAEEGRGLAIINEIMDQVSYETREGKNCLRMIKNI
jgi:serine/threonine-protein kinase RsbW